MNSMAQHSTTEFEQACLVSKLSGKPVKAYGDIFAWHDKIMDRATAIVAFVKVYRQVPVNESARVQLYKRYLARFENHPHAVTIYNKEEHTEAMASNIWFSGVCRYIRGSKEYIDIDDNTVKQILIDLHS